MSETIECKLELPYKLIDIGFGDERFVLSLRSVNCGRSVCCDFEVCYRCGGIESRFACDLTPSDVYCFYIQLDDAYDIHFGRESAAVLESSANGRTKLRFAFDGKAQCTVSGSFASRESGYRSGVFFEDMHADLTDIPQIDAALKRFFDEMKRIKGTDTWAETFM